MKASNSNATLVIGLDAPQLTEPRNVAFSGSSKKTGKSSPRNSADCPLASRRVIVESARIVIEIDGERALATLLAGPDVVSIKRSRQDAQPAKHPIILDIPIALKRAGTGMKLVVPGARNSGKRV